MRNGVRFPNVSDNEASRNRVTVISYLLLLFGVLVIIGYSARNVIFERFTARNAPVTASEGGWVYIFGGRSNDGDVYREIYALDTERNRLRKLGLVPEAVSGAALVATPKGAYIIGGHGKSGYVDTIYFYDRDRRSLDQIGTLPTPRAYGGAAAAGEYIYFAGGFDGDERLSQIVRIDPETGVVVVAGDLPEARDGLTMVTHEDHAYILAGEGPNSIQYDTIVEIRPETGEVVAEYPVGFEVSRASALVYDEQLVALTRRQGGDDVILTLDLSVGLSSYGKFRPTDIETRDLAIAVRPSGLLAIGGEHPSISRQIGVWSISTDSRDVEPLRVPSRVWN